VNRRDAFHDGQAKAGATPISVSLSVGVEDRRQGVRGYSDSGVLDLQLKLRACVDDADDDTAPARREADRVGAEVHHELVQTFLVGQAREVSALVFALQINTHLGRLGVKLLEDFAHQLREVDRPSIDLGEMRAQA